MESAYQDVQEALKKLNDLIDSYNEIITQITTNKDDYQFDEKLSEAFNSWSDILNMSWQTDGSNTNKKEFDDTFDNLSRDVQKINSEINNLTEVQKITLN